MDHAHGDTKGVDTCTSTPGDDEVANDNERTRDTSIVEGTDPIADDMQEDGPSLQRVAPEPVNIAGDDAHVPSAGLDAGEPLFDPHLSQGERLPEPFLRQVEQEHVSVQAEVEIQIGIDREANDHSRHDDGAEANLVLKPPPRRGDLSLQNSSRLQQPMSEEIECRHTTQSVISAITTSEALYKPPPPPQSAARLPSSSSSNEDHKSDDHLIVGPDFKAQCDTRSFLMALDSAEDGDGERRESDTDDDPTISALDVAPIDDEYQHPSPASSSRQLTDSSPETLPVADAVLVSGENETSMTEDTASNPSNHSNHHNSSEPPSSSDSNKTNLPRSDRRFWVIVIVVALLLNSLLVGAAVVGAFCAMGKCQSSDSSATNLGPSPAPSGRLLSESPTETPVDRYTPPDLTPTEASSFTPSPSPAPSPSFAATAPEDMGVNWDEPAGSNDDGPSLVTVVVGLVVGIEVLVVLALLLYYRRWKRRKLSVETLKAPEAAPV